MPVVRIESSHERETWHDPLTPLVGAVGEAPPSRRKVSNLPALRKGLDDLKNRYHNYLDFLILYRGNRIKALAAVFDIEEEVVQERQAELLADVQRGMATSQVGDLLERADIGKAARVQILRDHAYSGIPAASLAALKLIGELDGDKHDIGARYESRLRRILAEG